MAGLSIWGIVQLHLVGMTVCMLVVGWMTQTDDWWEYFKRALSKKDSRWLHFLPDQDAKRYAMEFLFLACLFWPIALLIVLKGFLFGDRG